MQIYTKFQTLAIGRVLKTLGSRDPVKDYCQSVAPSRKIEPATFSALPKFQECGNRIIKLDYDTAPVNQTLPILRT